MWIILLQRITNGNRVFEIEQERILHKALEKANEYAESVGKLESFVYPNGKRNSDIQGYVNGNPNDVFKVDVLDSGWYKVDETNGNVYRYVG